MEILYFFFMSVMVIAIIVIFAKILNYVLKITVDADD